MLTTQIIFFNVLNAKNSCYTDVLENLKRNYYDFHTFLSLLIRKKIPQRADMTNINCNFYCTISGCETLWCSKGQQFKQVLCVYILVWP